MIARSASKSLKISELHYYFAAIQTCQPFSLVGMSPSQNRDILADTEGLFGGRVNHLMPVQIFKIYRLLEKIIADKKSGMRFRVKFDNRKPII